MYDHDRLFVRLCVAITGRPGASLRSLATGLGVHPHTIAEVVRQRTGVTFSAWRARRLRVAALALLRNRPDLSIKEVAAAAGFNSTSVFDRFMRRTSGVSPSEWRRAGARCAGGLNINTLDDRSTDDGSHGAESDATLDSSTSSLS